MDIDVAILLAIAVSILANLQPHTPTISTRWLTHISSQEPVCGAVENGCAAKPSRWARR